jgi:heme o synthase
MSAPSPISLPVAAVNGQTLSGRLHDYYELTKPRMNGLVVTTTAVGYYMALAVPPDAHAWVGLLNVVLGTTLTAASAAVLNQVIERVPDLLMPRTANRPVAAGRVSAIDATVFGVILGVVGMAYLALVVNPLTCALGLLTWGSYLFVYTPLKRVTSLNTVVGAIPGAIPPVMGWTAVHNAISPMAAALFGILFLWQMPHFLAIAVMYAKDYTLGGYKMLPVVDPTLASTKRMSLLYCLALIPVSLVPTLLGISGRGGAGSAYAAGALVGGLAFLTFAGAMVVKPQRPEARRMFFCSIIYLPLLLALMMIDKLPA